jgi:two-component system LytT family response regulator
MIKALIIDDEPLARSIIKEYLQGHDEISIVQECNDGFEGVKAITQHQPDLIFLDIQMPKINGFEMLELIDQPPAVIFTTAFDEYAIKAFDARAVDYLLKPFSRERLEIALQKLMERGVTSNTRTLLETPAKQPEEQQRIVVKTGNHIRIIPVQDIHYIEAYDDYVKIHSREGVFLKKKTMAYFEQALDASMFVRVHRSYIIQLSQITRIESADKDSYVAITREKERIPLSKSGYSRLKGVLGL